MRANVYALYMLKIKCQFVMDVWPSINYNFFIPIGLDSLGLANHLIG